MSVKIRTNEEIDVYDEAKLEKERDALKNKKVDNVTLVEYIKLSIEILMNMKQEDFLREGIRLSPDILKLKKEFKVCNKCKKPIESRTNSNKSIDSSKSPK